MGKRYERLLGAYRVRSDSQLFPLSELARVILCADCADDDNVSLMLDCNCICKQMNDLRDDLRQGIRVGGFEDVFKLILNAPFRIEVGCARRAGKSFGVRSILFIIGMLYGDPKSALPAGPWAFARGKPVHRASRHKNLQNLMTTSSWNPYV